jgi:hypothetical protein
LRQEVIGSENCRVVEESELDTDHPKVILSERAGRLNAIFPSAPIDKSAGIARRRGLSSQA